MPTGIHTTIDRKQVIIEAHQSGQKPHEIVNTFGCSRDLVFKVLREFRGPTEQKRLTTEQRQAIIDAYKDGASSYQIKRTYDVSQSVAHDIAKAAGIVRRKIIPSQEEKQAMVAAYLAGKSTVEVGKEFGVSDASVAKYCKRAGINLKTLLLSEDRHSQIIADYKNGASIKKIAACYGVSASPISDILKLAGVVIYKPYDESIVKNNRAKIIDLYQSGKSVAAIAEKTGISTTPIRKLLKREGIKVRSLSAANLVKWQNPEYRKTTLANRPPRPKGIDSHLWKGGKTRITASLRTCALYKRWRIAVFARDRATCQHCDTKGHKTRNPLQADHIYPFSALLHDHQIKTMEQAEACLELWDIGNGRTLCKSCHEKTDTYQNGAKKYLRM